MFCCAVMPAQLPLVLAMHLQWTVKQKQYVHACVHCGHVASRHKLLSLAETTCQVQPDGRMHCKLRRPAGHHKTPASSSQVVMAAAASWLLLCVAPACVLSTAARHHAAGPAEHEGSVQADRV